MYKNKKTVLSAIASVAMFLITAFPAAAVDSPTYLAKSLINIVRGVLSPIVVILNGFIILLTVIAVVKSGVRAQYLQALGMRLHLSMEWISVCEIILIFVAYAALYPITNAVVNYVASRAGAIYSVSALEHEWY